VVPGLFGSASWIWAICYDFGDTKAKLQAGWDMCKNSLIVASVAFSCMSVGIASYYYIELNTVLSQYVDDDVKRVDQSMLFQTFLLAIGLGILYIAKYIMYQEQITRRPNDTPTGKRA
jgi:hypothetical protein